MGKIKNVTAYNHIYLIIWGSTLNQKKTHVELSKEQETSTLDIFSFNLNLIYKYLVMVSIKNKA